MSCTVTTANQLDVLMSRGHLIGNATSMHALQGSVCWLSMCRIRQVLQKQLGTIPAQAFMIVTAMQFHLPFYMSRTLPNTFALAVLGFAVADWVDAQHPRRSISLLAFVTVSVLISVLHICAAFDPIAIIPDCCIESVRACSVCLAYATDIATIDCINSES